MGSTKNHLLLILLSIIVSLSISLSADLSKLELGALINLIYPILAGFISLILYFILRNIFKAANPIYFLISAILFNLLTGIYIRFVDF